MFLTCSFLSIFRCNSCPEMQFFSRSYEDGRPVSSACCELTGRRETE